MKNAVFAILFFALVGAAQALEPPGAELLKTKVATELPSYWQVTDFRIEASANYGDDVEPLFKQRVVATIAPVVALFVETSRADDVIFLRPATEAKAPRQLFLLVTSSLHAGAWRPQFERQSDPVRQGGMPREAFPGMTIVEGSAEEEAFLERKEVEAERRHRAELARIEREKQQELARIEREQEEALARAAAEVAVAEKEAEQKAAARLAEIERQMETDAAAAAAEAARRQQAEIAAQERRREIDAAEEEKRKHLQDLAKRLESSDPAIRAAALQRALQNGDDAERSLATAALMKRAAESIKLRGTIGGVFTFQNYEFPFVLLVEQFDAAAGSIAVSIQGPRDIGRGASAVGQLSGESITLGGDGYSISARYLAETGDFVGEMQAYHASWMSVVGPGKVSLKLF